MKSIPGVLLIAFIIGIVLGAPADENDGSERDARYFGWGGRGWGGGGFGWGGRGWGGYGGWGRGWGGYGGYGGWGYWG